MQVGDTLPVGHAVALRARSCNAEGVFTGWWNTQVVVMLCRLGNWWDLPGTWLGGPGDPPTTSAGLCSLHGGWHVAGGPCDKDTVFNSQSLKA